MWELGSPAGWRCKGIHCCSHEVKLSHSLMRFRGSRKTWVFTQAWREEPDKELKKTRSFLRAWNTRASPLLNTSCLCLLSLFCMQTHFGFGSKQLHNKSLNVRWECQITREKSSTWLSFRASGHWLLIAAQHTRSHWPTCPAVWAREKNRGLNRRPVTAKWKYE